MANCLGYATRGNYQASATLPRATTRPRLRYQGQLPGLGYATKGNYQASATLPRATTRPRLRLATMRRLPDHWGIVRQKSSSWAGSLSPTSAGYRLQWPPTKLRAIMTSGTQGEGASHGQLPCNWLGYASLLGENPSGAIQTHRS